MAIGTLKRAVWFFFDDDSSVVVVPPEPLTVEMVYLQSPPNPYRQLEVHFSRDYGGVANFAFWRKQVSGTTGNTLSNKLVQNGPLAYQRSPAVGSSVRNHHSCVVTIVGGADDGFMATTNVIVL